jgi:hypothetical protein
LGLHQPDVSLLVAGKLDRFSIELLLRTADRLGVEFRFDPKDNAKAARFYARMLARCQEAVDTRDGKRIAATVKTLTDFLIAGTPLEPRLRRRLEQDAQHAPGAASMAEPDPELDLIWLMEELESLIADLS